MKETVTITMTVGATKVRALAEKPMKARFGTPDMIHQQMEPYHPRELVLHLNGAPRLG